MKPNNTTLLVNKVLRSVDQVFRSAGDLLADASELSTIIGFREAEENLEEALSDIYTGAVYIQSYLTKLRKGVALAHGMAATSLKIAPKKWDETDEVFGE
jgi:hypothetical protein